MRIGIVVDSACDLPAGFIRQHAVTVLPITVRMGKDMLADCRDEDATLDFINAHVPEEGAAAETIPFQVEQIRDLFLNRLILDYDHVLCLTITRNRSPIYDNAMQASFAILNAHLQTRQARRAAGHSVPFSLRVIDTQNLFAAQAVPVVEAVRLRQARVDVTQMRERLESLIGNVHGYMVPRDLYYIRSRARLKGERSVGLFSVVLGGAMDIKPVLHCNRGQTRPVAKVKGFDNAAQQLFGFAQRRVAHGLLTPVVCISYGGRLDEMRALPGYLALRNACQVHGVELYESVMSLTGMVNVGKGALFVGFADEPHEFNG